MGGEITRRRRSSRGPGCLPGGLAGLALAVALVWVLAPALLEAYARWLIVDDPLHRSDSVVALSGGDGERLAGAIQLYKKGLGASILIVGPDIPFLKVYTAEDSLTQGEAKRRIAIKRGIPADSVILALGPTSTWEEARRTLEVARSRNWKSIIVITDPFHTRRARAVFRHVFRGQECQVAFYHLPLGRSSQNVPRWWKRESDTMAVMTESIKLCFYMYNYHVWP
jgi:uncharacterized SAM-binding protein YcdF (DUF218 family)